jgi:hypothetical protein
MQRPREFGLPRLVRVVIPGWVTNAGAGNRPRFAVISSASINRTHIAGTSSRAVRAIISVTLREARQLLGASRSVFDRANLNTAAGAQAQAQIQKIIGDAATQRAAFEGA